MSEEFYIDIVTKALISKLSEELLKEIKGPLTEQIKGLIQEELRHVISGTIEPVADGLTETLRNVENKLGDIEKTAHSKLDAFIASINEHDRGEEQSIIKTLKEQLTLVEGHIKNLSGDLESRMNGMEINILALNGLSADLKKYIKVEIENSFKASGDVKGIVQGELTGLKQVFEQSKKSQNDMLSSIFNSLKNMASSCSEGKNALCHASAQLLQATLEVKNDIYSDTNKLLKADDRLKEFLNIIETQLNDIMDKIKTSSEVFAEKIMKLDNECNFKILVMLSEIRRKQDVTLAKSEKAEDKQLTQMAMILISSADRIKQAISLRGEEMTSVLNNTVDTLTKHTDNKLEFKSTSEGTKIEGLINRITEFQQNAQESDKEINDLLNDVYSSVKKLVNASDREKGS
ncbi:MAG: hypothetical protein HQK94_09195 [Nitrospirae bacterium]|nr:hypothetical protein [Nitrospirota bacterium]